jgi:ubiquitin-conjugating enzyme E2 W
MSKAASSALTLKRIRKELEKWDTEGDDGLKVDVLSDSRWHVSLVGAEGTIYQGETYVLVVDFEDDYPMSSPIVQFKVDSETKSPEHEHCYSNGHICLNILGSDWSPALTVKSVMLSILSMLSSATKKKRPDGDSRYSSSHPPGSNPKHTRWLFDDDKV